MTQDEIIRMAREAELYSYLWGGDINQQSLETLERFADLVAAHEREACAKVCENFENKKSEDDFDAGYNIGIDHCAAAIRAMGEK